MTTGVGRTGFVQLGGQHHHAVGYWGRYSGLGVHSRVIADQSIFKMLKLNVDKVLGMGLAVDLWREVFPRPVLETTSVINGITIIYASANSPSGTGTLALASGTPKNLTWAAPGGSAGSPVAVAAGGTFRLFSGSSYISVVVEPEKLPTSGSISVTVKRSIFRSPNFNQQTDQTTLTNRGFPLCSCYKDTSKQPDDKCLSCYGTGIIPGYTKHGFTEYTMASIDSALVLVNTSLSTDRTPHRLGLSGTNLTGTITTADFAVSNALAFPFEFDVRAYLRQTSGTSIVTEFSTNGGGVYNPINNINVPSPPTSGTIRFRVTLNRTLAADKTPLFEILRVRHARTDEPFIRVLKGLPTRTRERGAYGVVDSDGNWRWWTVPLRHFDATIAQDPDAISPPEDNLIQQQSFIEFREGVHVGTRFGLTAFEYHDPKGIFISQGFSCRRVQHEEIIQHVF